MRIPIFQVDAFTSVPFRGNPAAVCPLEQWPADELLQKIAAENNLSETAFFVREGERFVLRWFTPTTEVDLCGHATLASAWVVLERIDPGRDEVIFATRSGELAVRRDGELLSMDFPARPPGPCDVPIELAGALGRTPKEVLAARDFLVVYGSEEEVRSLRPDRRRIAALERFAVIATAPGDHSDFVSRFFAPGQGIDEDPVTGSAHCTLVPYWASRLGRSKLHALQVSARGGELFCEMRGDRVAIAGRCAPYLSGEIEIPSFSV